MDFIAGTFTSPFLYNLSFDPRTEKLSIKEINDAISGHSWLSFSPDQTILYCTAWTEPDPSIAAYRVLASQKLEFINSVPVSFRPGYICASRTHVYAVGGPEGGAYLVREDGGIGEQVQKLDFVTRDVNMSEKRGEVAHGDFGGLRHGAHSCDLSPDGKTLYVADIGRNCVWVYGVGTSAANGTEHANEDHLVLHHKSTAPRTYDGPRHAWPHPNGEVVYSVQEHSSMVDAFRIERDAQGNISNLIHLSGVNILPESEHHCEFWADEVRLSSGPDASKPEYLYASTRGLEAKTKGYVAVFKLNGDGTFALEKALDIWQTPTSGGIANAIEPAPWHESGVQYLAMTDSLDGTVSILKFDGKIQQVDLLKLPYGDGTNGHANAVVQAATAVWFIK